MFHLASLPSHSYTSFYNSNMDAIIRQLLSGSPVYPPPGPTDVEEVSVQLDSYTLPRPPGADGTRRQLWQVGPTGRGGSGSSQRVAGLE